VGKIDLQSRQNHVQRSVWGVLRSLLIRLLQICCWVHQYKHFESQSTTFLEDMKLW